MPNGRLVEAKLKWNVARLCDIEAKEWVVF